MNELAMHLHGYIKYVKGVPRYKTTSTATYIYELVQKSRLDLYRLPNFGEKSLREVKETLANLALTLGMILDEDSYRAAVVTAVAASIEATRR